MPASRAVFAPLIAAIIGVVIASALAVHAGSIGRTFLPSLNNTAPLLAFVPPWLGPARPPLSRRVVLVIVDGLTLRRSYGIPFFDQLRRQGVDAVAKAHAPSISRPNYVSIATGVPPHVSGVRNNAYRAPVQLDSLMDRVIAHGSNAAYTSDLSSGFPSMFARDLADAAYVPWDGGFVTATRNVIARSAALIVVLPGAVDIAGHQYGAHSVSYRNAVRAVDRDLAMGLSSVDLRHETIIVTADHGHLDNGGHGGVEPDVLEVPLILAGAGIRPGAMVRQARLIDVAPTAAALLGVPAPGHGLGRTLVETLAIDMSTAEALRTVDAERIARNDYVVREDLRVTRTQWQATRSRRVTLVVAAAVLLALILILGTRWGALLFDWRALVIGLPAFPLAFHGLLQLVGGHLSLSALPDEGTGIRQVFYFGLAAIVIHLVATWLALGGRLVLRNRIAAANAITVIGLVGASLPAAASWALLDTGPSSDLPSARLLLLIPAGYVAVACYSAAAAVTLALEIVVFFARAFDPRWSRQQAQRTPSQHAPAEPEDLFGEPLTHEPHHGYLRQKAAPLDTSTEDAYSAR